MTEYINKSALVGRIELQLSRLENSKDSFDKGVCSAYNDILRHIDTLEVKEVDIEKSYHDFLQKEWFGKNCIRTISEMMAFTAKHFFELGLLNTITEEDCKLIWNIGDEIPYMPEEDFFKELLKRFKAQKGE